MAQLKRNQPPRACRNPPPVYLEPDLDDSESDDEELKEALVAKKRKLNQSRLRASWPDAPQSANALGKNSKPPKLDTILWRDLGDDLVECILSRLPVATLWDTVMAINPTRWEQILATCYANSAADVILGHNSHVDSAIGYIKAYSTQWRSMYLPPSDTLAPPPPRVLDHATQKWQCLPRYNTPEDVRTRVVVQSVSDGVVLLVQPENLSYYGAYRHDMTVWNPVSQSHRRLPRSPFQYDDPDVSLYLEVVVVGRARRSYKVVEFVARRTNDRAWRAAVTNGVRPEAQRAIAGYAVYDSVAASWGAIRPTPRAILEVRLNHNTSFVACEGCVCFVTVERQLVTWERPRGVACYDADADAWSEAYFPASFFDGLPGTHAGCRVHALLYASGKVHIIFVRLRSNCYSFYVASIALADVKSGVPGFELVARVRESERNGPSLLMPYHPAPKCWKSRPHELILQRPCARSCTHRWYMLPVGGNFFLCVVLCGRWHRRFDLVAEVWTEWQMEVPSDRVHDQEVQTTEGPSGSIYRWDTNVVPYIPSWVRV